MSIVISQLHTCQQPKTATIKKRIGFDIIDRNFWSDRRLNNSSKIVIGEINSNSKNFRPSLKTLSTKLGMSVNTIRSGVAQGEKYGYLKALRRVGRVTLYSMITPLSAQQTVSISDRVTVSISDTHRISNKEKHYHIHDGEAQIALAVDNSDLGVTPNINKKKNSSHSARKLRKKRKSRAKQKITYNGVSKTLKVWAINMANSVNRRGKWVDYQELNDFFFGLIEKYGSKAIEWIDRSDSVGLFTRRATLDMPWNKLLSDIELSIDGYCNK